MRNLKSSKIILVVLLTVMLLTVANTVMATGSTGVIQLNITTTPSTNTETVTNTTTNTTVNTEAPITTTNVVAPTNTSTSTYTNSTTLPQTGDASDYAIFLMIGVSIVIAAYAYKKVRDYNIK